MQDDSVGIENHRDKLLRLVKSLSLKVDEKLSNTNSSPSFHWFMEIYSESEG